MGLASGLPGVSPVGSLARIGGGSPCGTPQGSSGGSPWSIPEDSEFILDRSWGESARFCICLGRFGNDIGSILGRFWVDFGAAATGTASGRSSTSSLTRTQSNGPGPCDDSGMRHKPRLFLSCGPTATNATKRCSRWRGSLGGPLRKPLAGPAAGESSRGSPEGSFGESSRPVDPLGVPGRETWGIPLEIP